MTSSPFDFETPKLKEIKEKLIKFCVEEVEPAQVLFDEAYAMDKSGPLRWDVKNPGLAIMEKLKSRAKELGLWNLWMPKYYLPLGAGLTNLEYAQLAEILGRFPMASEACNCSAPDTGNMETLLKYGTPEQKEKWLVPLTKGEIRSAFLMTEPAVASSDASNICTKIELSPDGKTYKINGTKWWSSGAMDPRCKIFILMGQTDPENPSRHKRQSMILVPKDTPGVTLVRAMTVYGHDEAPEGHAEVSLKDVIVPASNILLGPGRGFEIAQGRLGPGRLHHCMRSIGLAERAQALMIARAKSRTAFRVTLDKHGYVQNQIAENRMDIDQARLMVLYAAASIDKHGDTSHVRREIAAIKVIVPRMACRVVDRAIQVHGAAGVSTDFPLAKMYAGLRTLRLADGPDEVHIQSLAKLEIAAGGRPLTPSKI